MARATAADLLVERLQHWGVEVVFGLPGDGINGIMESLRQRRDAIRFVQVRHEESAAFMACAYAKFTGRLGVCLATSGPGGLHLLNGLYDAKLDGQSVLAITGLPYHDLLGTFTQQDVPLDRVFADVAKYSERIMGPTHVESLVDLACRTALAYHGVAHLSFPVDIQEMPVEEGRSIFANSWRRSRRVESVVRFRGRLCVITVSASVAVPPVTHTGDGEQPEPEEHQRAGLGERDRTLAR